MATPAQANGEGTKEALANVRRVWIDQDLCTGDGLCTEIAPPMFEMGSDGVAYVNEDGVMLDSPGGSEQLANIPESLRSDVVDAALECPGECIFIEDGQGNQLDLGGF